jgi:predicted CopG family antitoxin
MTCKKDSFMRVNSDVKKELTKLKKFKRDSYSEVIKRLLKKEVK